MSGKIKASLLDSIRILVWERTDEGVQVITYHLSFFEEDPGETFIEVPPEERKTVRLRLKICDSLGVGTVEEAVEKIVRFRETMVEIPDSGVHLEHPEEWDGEKPFTLIVPNWLSSLTVEVSVEDGVQDWCDPTEPGGQSETGGSPLTSSRRTDIYMVLDRSSSMAGVQGETIDGFNRFLQDQLVVSDDSRMTMIQFSGDVSHLFSGFPLASVPNLSVDNYHPSGSTSLLDAIGDTIQTAERAESHNPVIVVQTDGEENTSHRFSWGTIKKMISGKREKGWEFIFLGETQEAVLWAASVGFPLSHSATYQTMEKFFTVVSQNLLAYRTGECPSMALDGASRKLLTE